MFDIERKADLVEMCAHRVFVTACERVSLDWHDDVSLRTGLEQATGDLLLQLNTYAWGMDKERICIHRRWPKDWWQAVRRRWLPRWWLRKYPVQYEHLHIDESRYGAVCPHLREPHNRQIHFNWLASQQT